MKRTEDSTLKRVAFLGASFSLMACLAAPFLFFWGVFSEESYKSVFLLGTFGWFLFASLWAMRTEKR